MGISDEFAPFCHRWQQSGSGTVVSLLSLSFADLLSWSTAAPGSGALESCANLSVRSSHSISPRPSRRPALFPKLQALVYDILPPLEEGAGKRCSECVSFPHVCCTCPFEVRPGSKGDLGRGSVRGCGDGEVGGGGMHGGRQEVQFSTT